MIKNWVGVFLLTCLFQAGFAQKAKINWVSIEEVEQKCKEEPRKVLVDVYTSWCGYCKKMDKTSYRDKEVVDYINKHFYAVKFNAEYKKELSFQGNQYKYVRKNGSGIHELAYALMGGGGGGYPTTVFLDEQLRLIQAVPGYIPKKEFHEMVSFFEEGALKEISWEEYHKSIYQSPYKK